MAGEEVKRKKTHHRKHGDFGASKSRKRSEDESTTPKSVATSDRPTNIDALRKARLSYLAKPPDEKRKDMKYEYVKRSRTVSQVDGEKEQRRHTTREHSLEREDPRPVHRSRRRTNIDGRNTHDDDDGEYEYVYRKPEEAPARDETHSQTTSKPRKTTTNSSSRRTEERQRLSERRHTEPVRGTVAQELDEV